MTKFAVLPMAVALLAGTAATAHAADVAEEAVTEFRFTADAGAHPLHSASGVWATPDREVRVWESENVVKIDSATWQNSEPFRLELSTPDGSALGVGAYQQGQAPETLRTLVIFNGLGCVEARAAVLVDRIERNAEGSLTAFDATLEHYCVGSDDQGLHAQVRYRA
ncbi:hypothetical protein QLQ12_36145 [Actinoplanes sp. NEAU-A12]|uniref:Uncharacterized protein n=1 Tax=Actinoplanes sandaracinus TaxID=3045177 RepID=A0ABT6WWA7_9ACTN|nr:hypothetical protein [Actinoplanes sandaracinus]MDI6104036.1 hypothetical protein [Actinoplanes sandaracinus]